jgi:hypothetical protein
MDSFQGKRGQAIFKGDDDNKRRGQECLVPSTLQRGNSDLDIGSIAAGVCYFGDLDPGRTF